MHPRRDSNAAAPMSLRRNFSWTFVGNVVYAGCQWAMLVVLAKLGTKEMLGQYALGLAVTAPIMLFAGLQLRSIQATDARARFSFGDYLGVRLLTTVVVMLVVAGMAMTGGYTRETMWVIVMVGVAKAVESISDVLYGLMQQHERMDYIARSMMVKGPVSLLALGIGVRLTGSVLWGAAGLAIAWTAILFFYDIPRAAILLHRNDRTNERQHSRFRPTWNPAILWRLTALALPLGLVAMLNSLETNIPRYYIKGYVGEGGLGIFAALSYILVGGNTVIGALAQSASPRLARYFAAGNRSAFRRLLLKLMAIGVALGAAGVVATVVVGRQVLTLLYSADYAAHLDVFFWLMVGAGISYVASFLGYALTAAQVFRIQFPLFSLTTGVAALVGRWLIPTGGLKGAAIAVLVTEVVQVVGSLVVMATVLRRGSAQRLAGTGVKR